VVALRRRAISQPLAVYETLAPPTHESTSRKKYHGKVDDGKFCWNVFCRVTLQRALRRLRRPAEMATVEMAAVGLTVPQLQG